MMTAQKKIVSEKDFAGILEPFASPFLSLSHHAGASADNRNSIRLHMGFLANVIKYASDVEHLLDRYRARYNLNWIYFRELTATAKNFGKASFLLEDIKKNFNREYVILPGKDNFTLKAEAASLFLNEVLVAVFSELKKKPKGWGSRFRKKNRFPLTDSCFKRR